MVKKLLILLLSFTPYVSFAELCKAPTVIEKNIAHKAVTDKQQVYFGAGYLLTLQAPQAVIFANDMMIYLYNPKGDDRKTISFQLITATSNNNQPKYMTQQAYQGAFGVAEYAETEEANAIRRALNLCDGQIIKYHIEGVEQLMVSVTISLLNKDNVLLYLFNKHSPSIEQVQFANFSHQQIDEILATLTTNKK